MGLRLSRAKKQHACCNFVRRRLGSASRTPMTTPVEMSATAGARVHGDCLRGGGARISGAALRRRPMSRAHQQLHGHAETS